MWKQIALAVALLAPSARAATVAPAAGKSFAPACRSGEIADSRPDPAWLRGSFIRDNCIEPALPAPLDGAKASRAQIVAAMAAARRYDAAAAGFRKCVADFVTARQAALTPSAVIIENHRILASRNSAARAGAQSRAQIEAFNASGSGCDQ